MMRFSNSKCIKMHLMHSRNSGATNCHFSYNALCIYRPRLTYEYRPTRWIMKKNFSYVFRSMSVHLAPIINNSIFRSSKYYLWAILSLDICSTFCFIKLLIIMYRLFYVKPKCARINWEKKSSLRVRTIKMPPNFQLRLQGPCCFSLPPTGAWIWIRTGLNV